MEIEDNLFLTNSTDSWSGVEKVLNILYTDEYNPWYGSVLGSILVGLSGIFPLLVIPVDGNVHFNKDQRDKLQLLLSFAVGGLLGDVFLHLLPHAWTLHNKQKSTDIREHPSMFCGFWVLAGLLIFIIIEKLFAKEEHDESEVEVLLNGKITENNNLDEKCKKRIEVVKTKGVSGYLNLMANVVDNFTHGLAVGGSFIISWRVGALTTLAILVHEVPHEVGDFAILLRAGFSRLEAAKAQIATASSSLFGACTALIFSSASHIIEEKTSWILPFTAGGFLHIALVSVLPELLKESNPKESFKQLVALLSGILVVASMTLIIEE